MRLSLEGIGAMLQNSDDMYVKVVELVVGGPAERGGELKPADRIIAVGQGENGELIDVEGWRLDDVVNLIRGPKGTVVRLKVIPADNTE
jgi:carboxyl-terminal processing protease